MTMLANGSTCTIRESGTKRKIRIEAFVGAGGEGAVWKGKLLDTDEPVAVKALARPTPENRQRAELLVAMGGDLRARCPSLCAPFALTQEFPGTAAPWFEGHSLEALTTDASGVSPPDDWFPATYLDYLIIALQLAQSIAVLDALDLVYGDIAPKNLMLERRGSCYAALGVVDFGSYVAPGAPPTPAYGTPGYYAPEIAAAAAQNAMPPVSRNSDAWALAVLLHELILLRHPGARFAPDEAKAMTRPIWHDAPGRTVPPDLPGAPTAMLPGPLLVLFTRAFERPPQGRPHASDWVAALAPLLWQVNHCPRCGEYVFTTAGDTCPHCKKDYPPWALKHPGGLIPLDAAATPIGRRDLTGSGVSRQHAIFRRQGPELWLEVLGRNGVLRRAPDGSWVRLPERQPVLLQPGPLLGPLRFGTVDVEVFMPGT